MKVLDLSVATIIGLASVASMVAWDPSQLLAQGRLYSEQASMKEYLSSMVSTMGIAWLHTASPEELCVALARFSNSSLQVGARGRSFSCSAGPPPGVPSATLTLHFPEGNLTLQAWPTERQ